jgi:signal transduction histidine kinase
VAEVSDEGRGFEPRSASGVGLSSMRERAAAVGGKLEIESSVGRGTRLHLRIPMAPEG